MCKVPENRAYLKHQVRGVRRTEATLVCGKILFLFAFFIINSSLLTGLDFSLRPKLFLSIPMGSGSTDPSGNKMYSVGGGGDIGFEIDLSTVWPNPLGLGYAAGIEGGMMINPFRGDDAVNVSFYSFGGSLGLYYFPLSQLFTRIDMGLGVGQSANDSGKSDPGLFWRMGGEAGFRFTPRFTLAANMGWRQYAGGKGRTLNSGLYTGLTAQISFQTGRGGSEGINAALDQYGAVYPAFMQIYQTSPIGTVVIRNNENAEIRDLRLFFRASGYTASEFPCGSVSIVPRGRSADIPLLADFSPDILRFTGTGRIMGELVIRYRFLGQEREAVRAVTVATHDRNRVTAGDAAALAAFISPTAPETLDFARFIAGLERANRKMGHNTNMQYVIWLFEGLRASGIQLRANRAPETGGGEGSAFISDGAAQFPAETLLFRSGSARDLALLFSSCLEGVGIRSALIQTDGELLAAVSLDIGQSASETLFSDLKKILIIDEEVWLPLAMSAFSEGFMAAWTRGMDVLDETFRTGAQAEFIAVQEAWANYPPAPLPELGRSGTRTDNAAAAREVNRVLQAYIEQEITAIIRLVQTQINTNPTAALHNRMGILQARAGRINEAKTSYERAAGMGSVPAMTNRGNLALIEMDYATAERWFRQTLQRDSQNKAALRGLERIAEND